MSDDLSSPSAPKPRPFLPRLEGGDASLDRLVLALDRDDEERLAAIDDEVGWAKEQEPSPRRFVAAAMILRDLLHQGWRVEATSGGIFVQPHEEGATKDAVRRQLLFGRKDQLDDPAVRRFIRDVESPSKGSGYDSIVNLIADGRALAGRLRPVAELPRAARTTALRGVCSPYLQVVEPGRRDAFTNLPLIDVWRYFRYTWASRYRRPPGRLMLYLIRDAAQPNHPIMGLTALSNAVLQLTPRDEWIGWTATGLLTLIARGELSDDEVLHALRTRVEADLAALYTEDLGFDGARPPLLAPELATQLRTFQKTAVARRQAELRAGHVASRHVDLTSPEELRAAAVTALFQVKRAAAALALLGARDALALARSPLREALASPETARAVEFALRQVKQQFSSRALMELSTCGAVPPYGDLLGGKLAVLMMLSPSVRRTYQERYEGEPGVIASQMAGRQIIKAQRLLLLGTTSLYSERSSQYNRLRLSKGVVGNADDIALVEIGRSRGHGSSNLSAETEDLLASLVTESKEFTNVNFRFGEGQSPKMRQIREGLAVLGLNAADLLQHASPRIIYLSPLEPKVRRVLLGLDPMPEGSDVVEGADEHIAEFWRNRWLASRLEHKEALERVSALRPLELLVSNGVLDQASSVQLGLFSGT
jgi:hypothetical protein